MAKRKEMIVRAKALREFAPLISFIGWAGTLIAGFAVIITFASMFAIEAVALSDFLGLVSSLAGLMFSFVMVGFGHLLHSVCHIVQDTRRSALALEGILSELSRGNGAE